MANDIKYLEVEQRARLKQIKFTTRQVDEALIWIPTFRGQSRAIFLPSKFVTHLERNDAGISYVVQTW